MHAFLDEGGVGAAVLQLRSRWDPARRVQAVVGEASIRDGAYISDDDQHIGLEGVYVEPTGMLAMLGESRIASAFADANATAAAATAAGDGEKYDASRDDASRDDTSRDDASNTRFVSARSGPSERARGKYREALRVAARDVTGAPFASRSLAASAAARATVSTPTATGSGRKTVPGSPGLSQMQRNERMRALDDAEPGTYPSRCSFSLKLWVEPGAFKPVDPARAAEAESGYPKPGVPDARERVAADEARGLAERRAAAWSRRTEPADRAVTERAGRPRRRRARPAIVGL